LAACQPAFAADSPSYTELVQDRLAVQELTAKAEAGDAQSQVELGTKYFEGREVPKDDKKAVAWFEKAAQQGHAEGLYNLGLLYYYGYGVKQDFGQALQWYTKAGLLKHGQAIYEMSVMYERGEGSAPIRPGGPVMYPIGGTWICFWAMGFGGRYLREAEFTGL